MESKASELARYFYGVLFTIAPDTRAMFPVNMAVQRDRLLRALIHIVRQVDRPEELMPFLRQLGRDHRKFDVIHRHYDAVGKALCAALQRYLPDEWTPEVEKAWLQAYGTIARAMRDAADEQTGPAWWPATVLSHQKVSRDVAIVRVQPQYPLPYRAGNHVSVEVPQRPRMWRYLSPANAPRADGSLEFHVRTVLGGWVSGSIVNHTRPGDVWRLGPALGALSIYREPERPVVMIGGGTGVTPLLSLIEDLTHWPKPPTTQLFFGGRTPDDLYELDRVRALTGLRPWLTVTPVCEEGTVPGGEGGTVVEAILRRGSWSQHEVLISGSPSMIKATVSQLLVMGQPLERIKYDPFTVD